MAFEQLMAEAQMKKDKKEEKKEEKKTKTKDKDASSSSEKERLWGKSKKSASTDENASTAPKYDTKFNEEGWAREKQ
jgi:hypothetical protein